MSAPRLELARSAPRPRAARLDVYERLHALAHALGYGPREAARLCVAIMVEQARAPEPGGAAEASPLRIVQALLARWRAASGVDVTTTTIDVAEAGWHRVLDALAASFDFSDFELAWLVGGAPAAVRAWRRTRLSAATVTERPARPCVPRPGARAPGTSRGRRVYVPPDGGTRDHVP